MTGDTTPEQLRQELRDLDAEIAELRVSEQPADTEDEVRDSEEIAADLTTEEEQQAILGILERRRYQERPERFEYHLTEKGLDFKPVILALTEWGDRWAAPEGPPIVYEHDECSGPIGLRLICEACGASPAVEAVRARQTEVLFRGRERRRAESPRAGRGR